MAILGIRVVSVPVRDLDRSRRFYEDALGFEVIADQEFAAGRRWIQLRPPGGGTTVTLATWTTNMPPGGLEDVYLACDEIEPLVAALRERGVTFDDGPFDTPFGKFAHFRDPDGNRWVLHEP
ncbi:MAG: VOC family protein [Firmicutes bacterium]|nr:VOC family protein [Bacillota bacterium]